MSFGSAASRRPRRPDDSAPCPCGSGDAFGGCCGSVIAGADAPTAERLMRSRYTAFWLGDAGHLTRTWHPRTRPDDIDVDPEVRWTRLEIVDAAGGGQEDATGVVEFRAGWEQRSGGTAGEVHERSRFARVRGRWFYLDADPRPRERP